MNFKSNYRLKKYGLAIAKRFVCRVSDCVLDCGDRDTLVRHMKREHPDVEFSFDEDNPDQSGASD
jgi:hypothetical protein